MSNKGAFPPFDTVITFIRDIEFKLVFKHSNNVFPSIGKYNLAYLFSCAIIAPINSGF